MNDGFQHTLFLLTVFKTDMFNEFKHDLVRYVDASSESDHLDSSLKRHAPELMMKFNQLSDISKSIYEKADTNQKETNIKMQEILNGLSVMPTKHNLKAWSKHIGQFNFDNNVSSFPCNDSQMNHDDPVIATASSAIPAAAPPNESELIPAAAPPNESELAFWRRMAKLEEHKSIHSLWDEWFGLGVYSHGPSNYSGGIHALEKRFKNAWRSHWNGARQKVFSRSKFLINYVKFSKGDEKEGAPRDEIAQQSVKRKLEEIFEVSTLSAIDKKLKQGIDLLATK